LVSEPAAATRATSRRIAAFPDTPRPGTFSSWDRFYETPFRPKSLRTNLCPIVSYTCRVSSQPATEGTGAMGREIESRQGIGW
jgi:hypothetical protein